MSPGARKTYFRLWNAACAVKGWNAGDDDLRRAVVIECMEKVRGPLVTTSSPDFGPDETTALFVYLDHLAHPSDMLKSAAWVDCQTDYHAYNRARQADWHETKVYGKAGSSKLRKDRFNGQRRAAGEPLDRLDPEAIRKRHLTMVTRHEQKGYRRRKPQANDEVRFVAEIAGRRVVGPHQVAAPAPAPARVEIDPENVPF